MWPTNNWGGHENAAAYFTVMHHGNVAIHTAICQPRLFTQDAQQSCQISMNTDYACHFWKAFQCHSRYYKYVTTVPLSILAQTQIKDSGATLQLSPTIDQLHSKKYTCPIVPNRAMCIWLQKSIIVWQKPMFRYMQVTSKMLQQGKFPSPCWEDTVQSFPR